jgi:hypothetical protein
VALVLRALLGVWFVRRLTGSTAFGYSSVAAMVVTVVPFLIVPWVLDLRDMGVTVQAALVLALCLAIMAALAWVFRRPLSLDAFKSLLRR